MTTYQTIVFMQGDEADEVLHMLYDVDGVVWSGPYAESITRTIEHLKQWEYGENTESAKESSAGTSDRQVREGEYLLTWNAGLGYIGLERVDDVAESDAPSLAPAEIRAQDALNHPHDEDCPRCGRRQWTDESAQETCQACGFTPNSQAEWVKVCDHDGCIITTAHTHGSS